MPDNVDDIERQLDKFESTATNLETLAYLATEEGKDDTALTLQKQAQAIRIQQFHLYRKKQAIQVASNEWQSLVASLKVVNQFIDQAMDDLEQIIEVIKAITQLAKIADQVLKNIPKVAGVL